MTRSRCESIKMTDQDESRFKSTIKTPKDNFNFAYPEGFKDFRLN